jgi:hypothetical protein
MRDGEGASIANNNRCRVINWSRASEVTLVGGEVCRGTEIGDPCAGVALERQVSECTDQHRLLERVAGSWLRLGVLVKRWRWVLPKGLAVARDEQLLRTLGWRHTIIVALPP